MSETRTAGTAGVAEVVEVNLLEQVLSATKQTEPDRAQDLVKNLVQQALDGTVTFDRNLTRTFTRAVEAIDRKLSAQLNAVMHDEKFTKLEGSWRGLHYLVMNSETGTSLKIRMLNISKRELNRDLTKAVEFDQSQLFKKIYENEFGSPGGEPFGLLLVDHEVKHLPGPGSDDVSAIAQLSAVAAAAFVPVVLAASPGLLEVDNFAELAGSMVPAAPLRAPSHARWRALGQREDMRFACVTLPRVLARTPWLDDPGRHDGFRYAEYAPDAASRIWMTAGYAFASCVARAYAGHAWPADVRGVERDREGGGVVLGLPVEPFATDPGHTWIRPSLDLVLTDAQERDLVEAGLMPLCAVPFGPESAFSAVRSLQSPVRRAGAVANANAHMSAQINSMLCVSRFAHYIKVIGRDMVGSMATADEIERRLQDWLSPYVNGNVIASRDNRARHPLVSGRVLLAELLLFTGNVERADVILDAATDIAPDAALVVAEFRQLLRAELARRQLYRDGRVPEFLGDPTAAQSAALGSLVACRAGDMADAAQFAEAAEVARPRVPGQAAGMPFDDFRDADDLSSTSFEVLTTTGGVFLDTGRAGREHRIPPAQAPARPVLAARQHVGAERAGRGRLPACRLCVRRPRFA